jgi:hypothetical protein
MTLPHYNMPPLTPHKPTPTISGLDNLIKRACNAPPMTEAERLAHGKSWARGEMAIGSDADEAAYRNPTPTISQMEDRYARQVFTDKAERVVNQVLAFALTVLAVVFVGGLMYKTFVWGH